MQQEPLDDDFTFLLDKMIAVFNHLRELDEVVNKIEVNEEIVQSTHFLYKNIVHELQQNDWNDLASTKKLQNMILQSLLTAPPVVVPYTLKTIDLVRKFYEARDDRNAVHAMKELQLAYRMRPKRWTQTKEATVPPPRRTPPTVPPSPSPSPPLFVPNPRIGERIRVRWEGNQWFAGVVHAYQQKNKWIIHYDDGDKQTHNLTRLTWDYDAPDRVILPIAFGVVTRFDMPDNSKKWLHGRIKSSAVQANKVTYTVEYTKSFVAKIDQRFEEGTGRPVFDTVTYPKFAVGDTVQTLFVDDTGAHAWWTGSVKVAKPLDRILASKSRKHYLVRYSDGEETWMHSQDLMPQSISLV